MAKRGVIAKIVYAIVWLTGVLVSLAVGFAMINKALVVPVIPQIATVTAGWIVAVLTIVGVVLAIIDKLK